MRIAFTMLAQSAAKRELNAIVLSGCRKAMEMGGREAMEGKTPPVPVDVISIQAATEGDLPDVVVALIDSVPTTALPAWISGASHVPLIGVCVAGAKEDDPSTIPPRWDDVVSIYDPGRLICATRRALRRAAGGDLSNTMPCRTGRLA